MLARVTLALVVAAAVPAAAAQPLAINATCAAAVASGGDHARTLRVAFARTIETQPQRIPAGYTIDISLVRLDASQASNGELQIRAEVRAALSDEHGVVRSVSSATSTARGSQRESALLQRDAITESARELAKRLSVSAKPTS